MYDSQNLTAKTFPALLKFMLNDVLLCDNTRDRVSESHTQINKFLINIYFDVIPSCVPLQYNLETKTCPVLIQKRVPTTQQCNTDTNHMYIIHRYSVLSLVVSMQTLQNSSCVEQQRNAINTHFSSTFAFSFGSYGCCTK